MDDRGEFSVEHGCRATPSERMLGTVISVIVMLRLMEADHVKFSWVVGDA